MLLNYVSPLAFGVVLAAAPAAFAQQAGAAKGGLEEVIVTARKVSEKLQDVPVAVTVFNAQALNERNATHLTDLSAITPSLTVATTSNSGSSYTRISMRGQVSIDTVSTSDAAVGVYVDGVYWARAQGLNAGLLDVSSVQTLKGPQGTLFGRNTSGGAILITTNDPDLNTFSGRITGQLGRFGYKRGEAVVNVPIISDKLALRAAFQHTEDDGYVTDDNHPQLPKLGSKDNTEAKIKLKYQANDDLSIQLGADIYRDTPRNYLGSVEFVSVTGNGNYQAGIETLGPSCGGSAPACFAAGQTALANYIKAYNVPGLDHVKYTFTPVETTKTDNVTLTVSQDVPFGNVKVIGGYRRMRHYFLADYDGSPYNIYQFSSTQDQKQYSVEGTVTGKAFQNKLDFAGGVFYFRETGPDSTLARANPDWSINPLNTQPGPSTSRANPARESVFSGDLKNSSVGIYGQTSYHLTDRLTLTGGLRWSHDSKAVTIANGSAEGDAYGITGLFFCSVTTGCPSVKSASFSGVNFLGGVDYKITDDAMIYAKASSAYRAGGVNLRQTSNVPGIPTIPFLPEKNTTYEAGLKSEFLNKRIRLNADYWYSDVDNLQRSTILTVSGVSTTVIFNAKSSEFDGGELELTAKVYDGDRDQLILDVNGSYLHEKYKDYHDSVNGVDRSHEFFPYAPKWTSTLAGTYKHQFDNAEFSFKATWVWDDGYHVAGDNYFFLNGLAYNANTPVGAGGALVPLTANGLIDIKNLVNDYTKKASGMLDLRAAVTFNDKYEVALLGHNVTNNRKKTFGAYLQTTTGTTSFAEPPAWFIQGTVKF
jgi:iron complex outermembrane receptor protein